MRFRLANFPQASNRSVPLSPFTRLVRKIREIFIEGEMCRACGMKVRSYFFKSSQIFHLEQCYIECGGCGSKFHFLCYLEAIGARKGDGAVYKWPQGSQNMHDIAQCPKCKGACHIMLDGVRKPFVDDEIVRVGM